MGFFKRKSEDSESEEPDEVGGPARGRRGADMPRGREAGGGDRLAPRAAGGPPVGRRRDSRRGGFRKEEEAEEEEKDESEDDEKIDYKGAAKGLLRDVLIAVIIMIILIGSMWAYTKNWPPMVVVESESMMHGDDSEVGVIDTGDLVLVKKIEKRGDIKTFFEGKDDDYKMYGEYGDVIIYKKNGLGPDEAAEQGLDPNLYTPVIHRAILWLEYNEEATKADPNYPAVGHFNIPEKGLHDISGSIEIESNFPAYSPGEKSGRMTLNLDKIYKEMMNDPHSGFITKGDHNTIDSIDQYHTSTPVKVDWVIGKARGELPWFGLIKLYVSGSLEENPAPPRSVNMLVLTIAMLIIIPILIDVAFSMYVKRKKGPKSKEEEEDEYEAALGEARIGRRGPGSPGYRDRGGRGGGGRDQGPERPGRRDFRK